MKLNKIFSIIILMIFFTNCKVKPIGIKSSRNTIDKNSQSNFTAPGKTFDVKGHNMHVIIEGENQKGPTVVFFHGAGDIALNWNLVLPKVGKFAKAVAIDHAGEGWSEHGHGMALNQQVFDSHEVLREAGLKPPYIVVGHSLGGILANMFATEYKDEIAGIVLVDATHPDVTLKIYNKEIKKMEWKKMRFNSKGSIPPITKTPLIAPKETASFQPRKDFGDMLNKFSEKDQKLFNWIYNERPWTYVKGQGKTYEAEIFQEMFLNREKYHLGNIPLIVITGGKKDVPEGDNNWTTKQLIEHSKSLQKDFLNLSNNSKQIFAKNSGHQIHIDEPEIVSEAIRKIIKTLKIEKH